jgi:hypothetical protein
MNADEMHWPPETAEEWEEYRKAVQAVEIATDPWFDVLVLHEDEPA